MTGPTALPNRPQGPRFRLALLLSGIRWRARSSLAMLAVAAFGAAAGAFGPMYLHGADQVVLNGVLGAAQERDAGLTFVEISGHGYPGPLLASSRHVPQPARGPRLFGAPVVSQFAAFVTSTPSSTPSTTTPGGVSPARTTFTFVPHPGHRLYLGSLTSRTDVCAHLHIVAGKCVLGRGSAVISTRTAVALRLGVGQTLDVGFTGSSKEAPIVVTGVYAPGSSAAPYWWGQNFFPFGTFSVAGAYEHIDDVFASPATVRALAPVRKIYPVVQLPLERRALSIDEVPAFRASLSRFERVQQHDGVRIGTRLFTLLGRAGAVEAKVTDIVEIIDLELALLAVVVLYFVASRTASEREPDVALAELRGYRSRSALGVALGEPVAIVLLAIPVGFLVAWAVAAAIAPAVFGKGVAVGPIPASAIAAGVAGVVGVLAAAAGARRGLALGADSAPSLTGGTGRRHRWAAVADAAVVAAAAAAFFELVVAGASPLSPHPLAALAPGLLAVALGLLCARALPRVLALTHRRSALSPRVPFALASRLVARRREFAAQVLVVTLAVGLLTFAACAWAIATTNRSLRAAFSVGASKVLDVSVRQGTTFLSAVRASDPSGRYAMAAVVERSQEGTTLALDASRMGAVVTWPRSLGVPVRTAVHRIVPSHEAPVVMLHGSSVEVTVDASYAVQPAPDLTMDLFDRDTQTPEQVTFGPVRPGTHTYRGSLAFLCTGGCRLVDLALSWTPAVSVARTGDATVSLGVRSLVERVAGEWRHVAAGLGDARRWTDPSGAVRLSAGSGTLDGVFRLAPNGTAVTVAPRDAPRALPVLVTPRTASFASGDGGPLVAGLDGGSVPGHTVGEVPALPGVGTSAVLANLHTAELFLSGPFTYDVPEVWLAKDAPPGIVRRLRAHGVRVVSTQTTAAAERSLAHDGISLAYLLYLVSAAAAGLLVVGATAFAMVSAARRREDELAALRSLGVSRRTLRRTVLVEQALVLGTALVAGTAAGLVSAAVALRSVPEFASQGGGPPLDLGLPPLVVAVTAAVLVVALGLVAQWHARTVARRATPDRLGGASG